MAGKRRRLAATPPASPRPPAAASAAAGGAQQASAAPAAAQQAAAQQAPIAASRVYHTQALMAISMECMSLQDLHKMVGLSSAGCQTAMAETFRRARHHMIETDGPSGAGGLWRDCHPANFSAMLKDRCVLCRRGGRGGTRILPTWGLYAHQPCVDKITKAWSRVRAPVREIITYELPRQVFARSCGAPPRDDRVLVKPHRLLPSCPSMQDLEIEHRDTIAATRPHDYMAIFQGFREGFASRTGYASWDALRSAVPGFVTTFTTSGGPTPDDLQLVREFVTWSPRVPEPLWKWCFINEQLHIFPPNEWVALLREAPAGFAKWVGEVERWSQYANFVQVRSLLAVYVVLSDDAEALVTLQKAPARHVPNTFLVELAGMDTERASARLLAHMAEKRHEEM